MAFDAGAVVGTIELRYDKAVKALKAVQQQTKRTMGQMTKDVMKHRQAIEGLGRGMLVMSAASTAAFAKAVQAAAGFEAEMRNVNAIFGVSESHFRTLADSVRQLATQVPQTARTLAQGLYQIASGGIAAADSIDVLRAASIAATAGVSDTRTAASALITVLNTYSLAGKDATYVSDVLFKTVEKGVLTFDDLASSLGMVVSAAQPAGVTIEEVGAAMAVMTRSGFDAAMSATSLARIMTTFLAPSDEFAAALKSIGIESASTLIRTEGLGRAVEVLNEIAEGQPALLASMGLEMRALRAAMALTRNEGKEFTDMLDEFSDASGASAKAFEEQSKSFKVQWDLMKSAFESFMITLGDKLLPLLREKTEELIKLVERVDEYTSKNRELTNVLVPLTAKVGLLTGAIALLLIALPRLVEGGALVIAMWTGPAGWVAAALAAAAAVVFFRKDIDKLIAAKLRLLDVTEQGAKQEARFATDLDRSVQQLRARSQELYRLEQRLASISVLDEANYRQAASNVRAQRIKVEYWQKAVDALTGAQKANTEATTSATEATRAAGGKAAAFATRVDAARKVVKELTTELALLTKGTAAYDEATTELAKAQAELNRLLGAMTREVVNIDTPMDIFRGRVISVVGAFEAMIALEPALAPLKRWLEGSAGAAKNFAVNLDSAADTFRRRIVPIVGDLEAMLALEPALAPLRDYFDQTNVAAEQSAQSVIDTYGTMWERIQEQWAEGLGRLASSFDNFRDFIGEIANMIKNALLEMFSRSLVETLQERIAEAVQIRRQEEATAAPGQQVASQQGTAKLTSAMKGWTAAANMLPGPLGQWVGAALQTVLATVTEVKTAATNATSAVTNVGAGSLAAKAAGTNLVAGGVMAKASIGMMAAANRMAAASGGAGGSELAFLGTMLGIAMGVPLQHGGIVTRPTLAMLGEGGHPEAVLPLTGPSAMATGIGRGPVGPVYVNVRVDDLSDEGLRRLSQRLMDSLGDESSWYARRMA